jgi:predicted transcriptional regulator
MAVQDAVVSDKQLALEALRRMPEGASLQEISEELAILAAIRRGEAAADAGRFVSHEDVKRRSATWTSQ